MMNQTVSAIDALAIAVYAFRQNNNQVIKDTQFFPGVVTNETPVKNYSNKSYVISTLIQHPKDIQQYPSGVKITEDLLQTAESIKTWFGHRNIMAMLTNGSVNEFMQKVLDTITQDQVKVRDLGILVWAPKLYHDGQAQEISRETSARYEMTSKFIGKPKDNIEIDLEVIEKRFVRHLNVWSIYGHDGIGNLVTFLTKHEKLCESQTVRARVREHKRSPHHNQAFLTILNFVKAV